MSGAIYYAAEFMEWLRHNPYSVLLICAGATGLVTLLYSIEVIQRKHSFSDVVKILSIVSFTHIIMSLMRYF